MSPNRQTSTSNICERRPSRTLGVFTILLTRAIKTLTFTRFDAGIDYVSIRRTRTRRMLSTKKRHDGSHFSLVACFKRAACPAPPLHASLDEHAGFSSFQKSKYVCVPRAKQLHEAPSGRQNEEDAPADTIVWKSDCTPIAFKSKSHCSRLPETKTQQRNSKRERSCGGGSRTGNIRAGGVASSTPWDEDIMSE